MAVISQARVGDRLAQRLASSEKAAARFYNRWIGGRGPYGAVGRLLFGVSGDVYARPFIRAASVTADDRVLEIGCGPAMNLIRTREWTASTQSYVGVDISPIMIEKAKQNAVDNRASDCVHPMVGGVNLAIATASVDVILLSHLVKYLTDDQLNLCFSECRRVLRAGGRLVLWEFAPLDFKFLTKIVLSGAGGVKLRSSDELQARLSRHGFTGFKPFTVITPWISWSNVALVASVARSS